MNKKSARKKLKDKLKLVKKVQKLQDLPILPRGQVVKDKSKTTKQNERFNQQLNDLNWEDLGKFKEE